ncbi:MAG TPA: class I SAM-dependent methyltransferase [Puia sp.]
MKDVLGQAIADYFHRSSTAKLWVHTRWGAADDRADARSADDGVDTRPPDKPAGRPLGAEKELMPVATYFRDADDMPELEWTALRDCKGRILDIGAGAGSHALLLQKMGLDVTGLDISALNAKTMKERGIRKVLRRDFFTLPPAASYDTLLLLMNGIGIAATLDGLHLIFQKARALLRPGGSLIFDSSDVAYLYHGGPPKKGPYYGEIFYLYEYRRQRTAWFKWLFVDKRTLRRIASQNGWKMKVLFEDDFNQYLVKCTPNPKVTPSL